MRCENPGLRILVRLPNWLGDAVMATGIFDQIHALFESPEISVTGPRFICDLFGHDPRIAKVFPYRPRGLSKYNPFDPAFASLKSESFDLAILLTQSFSTAYQIWWTRAHHRLGYSNEVRSFFLTHPIEFPLERHKQHLVITYQQLLSAYTRKETPIFKPKLFLSETVQAQAKTFLKESIVPTKVVGLCPQAAYGPAKQWPWERFRSLAIELLACGYGVVVFADSSGRELGAKITQGLDPKCCLDMSAKTSMDEFMALMQACDLLVTNDSGPMHLATALDKPLIAIFGSTDEKVTGPYSEKARVIHRHVRCSPCFKRVCPIDFRCMMQIEVSQVLKEVQQMLANS